MPEIAAPPEGPFMSIGIAAKLLKGTERDVERLVAAGKVEAKTLEESGTRLVNSGQVIFHIRAKRSEEIERRLTGKEPYERDGAAGCGWYDADTGRELRADTRRSYVDEPPLMLDVIPPGISTFCLDCPEGPDGRPCPECPAPCSPPPSEAKPAHGDAKRRPSIFDRIFRTTKGTE